MLKEINSIPKGLLEAKADELLDLLGGPTLIHLEGENTQPLFISTLLHGNETTGFYAIQKLLTDYTGKTLPRSLSIFIGNVDAAKQNQRHLDGQSDYNRIWPGTHSSDSAETDMMKTVVNIMHKRNPFASIDIHNNTGHNPHYACVNILNPHGLQLASLFSSTTVYFTSPKGVQSSAFSDFCPAIVLECGQSGQADGISHSYRFIEHVLTLNKIPEGSPDNLNLFHTVARVIVPKQFSFGIEDTNDIRILTELESQNFHELKNGMVFAEINTDNKKNTPINLTVINESSEDVTTEFFDVIDNQIILKRNTTLSMYTTNTKAVSQDCLCYFMEKIHLV